MAPEEKKFEAVQFENTPESTESSPESFTERTAERAGETLSKEKPDSTAVVAKAAASIATPPVALPKDEKVVAIENVLSEGLDELYATLPPARQLEFKEKGERTATAINSLLAKTKVNLRKIINLIRDWLKMLPGVNKFFLEQEAKIKADKVLRLKPPTDG